MSGEADSHLRSVVKALSWRALALLITVGVVLTVTGRVGLAAAIGLGDTLIKLGVYYAHERTWNRIRFGRVRPPEYQI